MGRLLGPDFPTDIALAVSGGGDSMAMLALAHNWTRAWGVRLWVVTVDHGLRPESAVEAEMVAAECALLGHPHAALRWHWDGQGNVMDAARRARLALIDRWRGGLRHVLMAHTEDDVAETFLMRLARGAGVDGLSAMAPLRRVVPHAEVPPAVQDVCGVTPPGPWTPGYDIVRPLLTVRREELRHYARVLLVPWVEDPTNDDPAYVRARMRHLLGALSAEGLDAGTLAATARRMRRARSALVARTADLARAALRAPGGLPPGVLVFDRVALAASDAETRLRLLSAALRWVAGAEYGPRAAPLEALAERLDAGGRGTLHGCEAEAMRESLWVWRDGAALRGTAIPAGAGLWDGRYRIEGEDLAGLEIRALGEDGWAQIPRPARDGATVPMRVARAAPALWDGTRLRAFAPLDVGPRHVVVDTRPTFMQLLLSD
ncbi:tRNA lysidine(34) synthetase TilS [Roseivivax sediminis]|nr:tRNA lysidine(34) synthetase TilS [Roseivivax sediminis]